jgi:beta-galactosidase
MITILKKASSVAAATAVVASLLTSGISRAEEAGFQREKLNFNQGWKFIRKSEPAAVDTSYPVKDLERWESVDLPHTVRVEPYTSSSKNYQGPATYVKRFPSQAEWKGKKLSLEFEGVMGVTDVWVNGKHLAAKQAAATGDKSNYGGYLPFVLDVSEALKFDGTDNVLTVIADNSDNPLVPPGKPQKKLDFSYFGGIYRDVWLHVANDIHITHANEEDIVGGGGIFVEYPDVSKESATVEVKTHVRNESGKEAKITLKQEILDSKNVTVGETTTEPVVIPAKGDGTVNAKVIVKNPMLWSLEHPNLHTLVTTVSDNGVPVDRIETRIGIRTIRITKEKGIEINGEPAGILSGVNRHQEYGYIGYAMPDSLHKRDAIKIKNAGINAVRTGHYPQDPAFIAACDEQGILLFEPTPGWQWFVPDPVFSKRISQNIQQMVRRDRNSPSILCYEVSLNETHPDNEEALNAASVEAAKAEKPGVIYSLGSGCNVWDSRTGVMGSFAREYGDYMWAQDGDFKGSGRTERSPDFFYPGGEARMVKQARERMWEEGGMGRFLGQLAAYQKSPLRIGSSQWTGFDHNRGYSTNGAACGMLDLLRIPKFITYLYASQRSVDKAPMVFIASNWTEKVPAFDKVTTLDFSLGTDARRNVDVYSNAAKVRLSVMQDGKVIWTKTQDPSVFEVNKISTGLMKSPPFLFTEVPYHKGTLRAEGLDAGGKVIAEHSVTTAGAPAKLVLKADDEGIDLVADGSDIMAVRAYVTDAKGNVCPTATDEITFTVTNGKIPGDGDKRVGCNPVRAVAGVIAVPVQSTRTPGDVVINASAPGLEGASLVIKARTMEGKTAPFTQIAQGELLDQGSTFLANKDKMASGAVVAGSVTVGTNAFDHSITLEKTGSTADYYLNRRYERLTGKVGISSADPVNTGREVVFKVYCDGVLKYASKPVTAGGTEDFDLNVGGVDQVSLVAVDGKNATTSGTASFLSPYIAEGTNDAIDEGALRQNLAPSVSPWSQDFTKGNPVWRIDLGKTENVRNALLKVQYDSMRYSYEIWTSPDDKTWTKQATNQKTAHNNQFPDRFTAKNVRYVKVVFTDVIPVGIDWGKKASVTGFEIYRDSGVESAREFLLKGLTVEGKDIIFNPTVDTYDIEQKGLDARVTLRALPYDPQASVKINGVPAVNPHGATAMKDAAPMTVDLQAGTNAIIVSVTSKSGTGTKNYTLHVVSDGGNSYNALECFVPNQNGANCWSYQYQDIKTGKFTDITLPMLARSEGKSAFGTNSKIYEYAGPLVMHPGNGTVNAVRTFRSPKSGHALINATARLAPGQSGRVLLRVYKNDTQIHPIGGKGVALGNGGEQVAKIENLPIELALGDEIRFVVDADGGNGGDMTIWDTTVNFLPPDLNGAKALEIKGDRVLIGPSDCVLTTSLSTSVRKKKGEMIEGADARWSIEPPVKGIEIDRFGRVTVAPGVSDTSFVVHAALKGKQSLFGEKTLSIKRTLRPVNIPIKLDAAKVFGSPAYAGNEAAGGCKRAFDGDKETFFDGLEGGFAGIEIGKETPVSGMRLYPRKGLENRLAGAEIQVADAPGGPWEKIHTVGEVLPATWYTFLFDEPLRHGYYRVVQPGKENFNIGEIEFLTPVPAGKSTYENINPRIRVTEALQSINNKGWLDTQLKIKADHDCEVIVEAAKVLDIDNKVDRTIEDSKTLKLKANEEMQTFLVAKWDVSKGKAVAKFTLRDVKNPAQCLKDGTIERR